MIIETTDNNFEEVILKSKKPIMLDVWAPWCGPCKNLAPILEDLSKIYHETVDVATCNIDENPLIARRFEIRSIPTVMFFRDGVLKNTQIGLTSRKMYETKITELIS
jgi:thioredoxin 1